MDFQRTRNSIDGKRTYPSKPSDSFPHAVTSHESNRQGIGMPSPRRRSKGSVLALKAQDLTTQLGSGDAETGRIQVHTER